MFVHGVQYANVENMLTSGKTNVLHSGRECQGPGLKSETRASLRLGEGENVGRTSGKPTSCGMERAIWKRQFWEEAS